MLACSLGFYWLAAFGDPGRITPKNVGMYRQLYPHQPTVPPDAAHCAACGLHRPARSKHCRACGW